MDKQSVLALGVTAGLGVGYFLGRKQTSGAASKPKSSKPQSQSADSQSVDEVERLIRPNILALTPYRCARDDYDQGMVTHCKGMVQLLQWNPVLTKVCKWLCRCVAGCE